MMRLLCVVYTDHPHGRAKPGTIEPLSDVALIHPGNLYRRWGTL
ncbi:MULTISPECIES: hypothetical protein [unclassified Methylobacterium]|nr:MULTISPECIES: hypothetical protein [unclassified Methylobacterium]